MSLLVEPNLVTTIIPVYNRPEFVVEAVESVLAQTHRPIEILVVDDGSSDETPAVLQTLAAQHQEIRLFRQSNSGPGAARELGRLNARGEYVQYLDSDDLLLANKFEDQIATLRDEPDAHVAYGKTECVNHCDEPQGKADRGTGDRYQCMFPRFLRERPWFTSTPLYRRSVVEAAGPWSELNNEEDWEYDCRIASLGGRLAYSDSFVSLHRRHDADAHLSSGGAHEPDKLRHRARARAKIYQHAKNYMLRDDRVSEISKDDWAFFSDYAFLLARQCSMVGLTTEARAMVSVSIEARGGKSAKHILFLKLVKFLGWQRAAKVVSLSKR